MQGREKPATPNSILRKRANKENQENETKSARKLRMKTNRRVSFAPDQELETMHIFSKQPEKADSPQVTEDLLSAGLNQMMPWNLSGLQPGPPEQPYMEPASPAAFAPPPYMAMPSPGFSPMSMDLTNNSYQFLRQGADPQGSGELGCQAGTSPSFTRNITSNVPGLATLVEEDEDGGCQAGTALEFTRNITVNVPCLSTLVEEDEEEGLEPSGYEMASRASEYLDSSPSSSDPLAPPTAAQPPSPVSPFVLREMKLRPNSSSTTTGGPQPPQLPQQLQQQHSIIPGPQYAADGQQQRQQQQQHCMGPQYAADGQQQQHQQQQRQHFMGPGPEDATEVICHNTADAAADDTDGLKGKWGFTPGREDTLDVSHGRNVMGEITYQNVYGNSTTGDLTAAMRLGPSALAINNLVNQSSVPVSEPADPASFPLGPGWRVPAQWSGHRPQPPVATADMTIGLLEEDNQTDVWRQPFRVPASVASNKLGMGGETTNLLSGSTVGFNLTTGVGAPNHHAVGGTTAPIAAGGGETTNLLAVGAAGFNLTAGVSGARSHVVSSAAGNHFNYHAVGGATATVNNFTAQLLADTGNGETDNLLEGFMQKMSHAPPPPEAIPRQAPLGDATAMSGIAGCAIGGMWQGGEEGMLLGQDLTLDDFARPPEPPTASLVPGLAQQLLPSFQMHNPSGAPAPQPSASLASQGGPPNMDRYCAPLPPGGVDGTPTQPPAMKRTPIATATAHAPPGSATARSLGCVIGAPPLLSIGYSAQKLQFGGLRPDGAPSPLVRGGPVFGSQSPSFGRFVRPTAPPQLAVGSQLSQQSSQPLSQPSQQQQYQQQQMEQRGHPEVPPITFQEFLQTVEVRFLDDMRRRTSFLPPMELSNVNTETLPETLPAMLDSVFAAGAQSSLSKCLVEELADVVEAMHMSNASVEGALARSNPAVFTAVQLAGAADLERIRDQMKLLKRLCRHRTGMAWKQRRIAFEQALSAEYRNNMAALNEEAEYMRVRLSDAQEMQRSVSQLDGEVERERSQAAAAQQLAAARKELRALQRHRLAELRASNAQRELRQGEAQERQAGLKAEYETTLEQGQQSQRQLLALRGEGFEAATPSTEAAEADDVAAERAAAASTLVQQQEKVDIILGLLGAQLDAHGMTAANASWSLTLRGHFRVTVRMQPSTGICSSSIGAQCMLAVEVLADGFKCSELSRMLLPHFSSLFASCISLPASKLPSAMDELQVRLGRASMLLSQLRTLPLSWPLLASVTMDSSHSLQLSFVHPESSSKMVVEVGAEGMMDMACTPPALGARVLLPSGTATKRSAEVQAVLSGINPGPLYLQHLCYVSSQLLCGATAVAAATQNADKDTSARTAARSPLRLYGNPLFMTPGGVN